MCVCACVCASCSCLSGSLIHFPRPLLPYTVSISFICLYMPLCVCMLGLCMCVYWLECVCVCIIACMLVVCVCVCVYVVCVEGRVSILSCSSCTHISSSSNQSPSGMTTATSQLSTHESLSHLLSPPLPLAPSLCCVSLPCIVLHPSHF